MKKEKKIKKGFLFNPPISVYNTLKALAKKNRRSMTGELEFLILQENLKQKGDAK